jgi:DNA-binding transcriptional MerR regulator
MKIEMRTFRIGALAEKLNVEKFVIRFWEKEFNIRPSRTSGKQRFYTEKDLERFTAIKELLYGKGFTIAGAKKHLKKRKTDAEATAGDIVASQVTTMEPELKAHASSDQFTEPAMPVDLLNQMMDLQKKLVKLRELL